MLVSPSAGRTQRNVAGSILQLTSFRGTSILPASLAAHLKKVAGKRAATAPSLRQRGASQPHAYELNDLGWSALSNGNSDADEEEEEEVAATRLLLGLKAS